MQDQAPGTADTAGASDTGLISVRKLAALDLALHGPVFILIEFGGSLLLGLGLGIIILAAAFNGGYPHSPWLLVFGCYVLLVGVNYLPLLLYAVVMVRRKSARAEVAAELAGGGKAVRRYTVQQFLLLIPLFMPILSIYQEARERPRAA